MGAIDKNRDRWATYEWPERGDEWSFEWGGTPYLWYGTIFPRIQGFLPADSILEIAPGYGRCTQYLLTLCRALTVVDLSERCVKACQERFKASSHIRYVVNDGKSLNMIKSNSIDFVFSWDSLVHAEAEVLHSYLQYLSAILRPGGHGFFHHSHIGCHRDPETGKLTVENRHWRAESMTGGIFRRYCNEVGLRCISQEIIGWGGDTLSDCLSLFKKEAPRTHQDTVIFENRGFMNEAYRLKKIAQLFDPAKISNSGTKSEETIVSSAEPVDVTPANLAALEADVRAKDSRIGNLERALEERTAYIQQIQAGHGWRFLTRYYALREMVLPQGTKRSLAAKALFKMILSAARLGRIKRTDTHNPKPP